MEKLLKRAKDKELTITILGMGYIGLPTAIAFAKAGFLVRGFDVNKKVIETLKSGK
ncbi:MAG: UDP-N-acetyl-D-mannosamine dehydrogenase, partial [Fusobacterium sp.]|nr:UDP-N-acetyl-D-mannosamine dehydrogenase [Fusobacterium sp.]